MHTVKSGDCLSRIARDNGVSMRSLLSANPQFQKNPDLIRPGQKVNIPGARDSFEGAPGGGQKPAGGGQAPAPAPAGPSGTNGAQSGGATGPANLQQAADRATQAAGVPASWARSPALWTLLRHESSLNPRAQNPHSTAYGLFQFLDSTWKGTGVQKTSDPYQQFVGGFRYIKQRYGTPEAAWAFWQKHHWY